MCTTFPFPSVATPTAETMAAKVVEGREDEDPEEFDGGCFLTITSSGAYLFTNTINPFPR